MAWNGMEWHGMAWECVGCEAKLRPEQVGEEASKSTRIDVNEVYFIFIKVCQMLRPCFDRQVFFHPPVYIALTLIMITTLGPGLAM